jgi:hypothetical protein
MNARTSAASPGRPSLAGLTLLLTTLTGCLSPIAMHQAVVQYDRTGSQIDAELLLLNIARARHYRPVHFTAVSNVAATFDFRVSAGITGRIGHVADPEARPVDLQYSNEVSENPTITILPIAGEEFTKRILKPIDETKFAFLAHQGFDVNMILRLMARGITIEKDDGPTVLFNTPSRPDEYREFRRRLLHLASLDQARKLFVGPLMYEEVYATTVDRAPSAGEVVDALQKGYRWSVGDKSSRYVLTRKVIGRITITNYDPNRLPNEERRQLNEDAERHSEDYLLVDIRPGHPGGEYPLHGFLMLRSLNSIIGFLAKGIAEETEYFVEPDPRTGPVMRNPAQTLEIEESKSKPSDAEFSIEFESQYYSIRKFPITQGMIPSWNQEAFTVLSNLFQMTVTDVAGVKTPIISIPKGG